MKKKNFTPFEDLEVWQDSHAFVLKIYRTTNTFPKYELFNLTSQLRRSATSIPTNIVEGLFRQTRKELLNFLYIARGSAGETMYHLILTRDLKYITQEQLSKLRSDLDSILKQLNGWIRNLKKKSES